jgi:hypothetical protein
MYKRLILTLALVSIFAALFGVAAAPLTNEKKGVSLVSVGYYKEKGVVFKFKLTGDFKDRDLKGSLFVNGQTVRVYCARQVGNGAICVAAAVTNRQAGKLGVISFAGSAFTVTIPMRPR